jgi:shikimate 5-dehydrogenase
VPEPQTFLSLLTGLFATPATENPTVAMIEAAYEHHHINARYLNCEVASEALGDAVRGARAMGGCRLDSLYFPRKNGHLIFGFL